jgi:hypothetical protein
MWRVDPLLGSESVNIGSCWTVPATHVANSTRIVFSMFADGSLLCNARGMSHNSTGWRSRDVCLHVMCCRSLGYISEQSSVEGNYER